MSSQPIASLDDLQTFTTQILETLSQNTDTNSATVVALHGDLGAGKTTFTQYVAAQLGVNDVVTSPTFVIMKRYEAGDTAPFANLVHIDAYRIEDIDEMRPLGFAALLQEKDTIICIEWAERIEALLPDDTTHLHFTMTDQIRSIEITHGKS